MQSKADTIKQYLDELPNEQMEAIVRLREVILINLPNGFKEK